MSEVELPNPHELQEMKEKEFTRRVALITAIFAVVLAVAALGKNYTMKEMLLTQQEASKPMVLLSGQSNPGAPLPEPENAPGGEPPGSVRVHEAGGQGEDRRDPQEDE